MRPAVLISWLALAVAAPAQEPPKTPKDAGIRIYYPAANLWRDDDGGFVGAREDGKLVLTYEFFHQPGDRLTPGYTRCPLNYGGELPPPECEDVQAAVVEALEMWADATEQVVLRRAAVGRPAHIGIAWYRNPNTKSRGPLARGVSNSRDFDKPPPPDPAEDFGGLDRPFYPRERQRSAALIFNDRYCWHLEEPRVCPQPRVFENGKTEESRANAALVALHEAGHVFGFGHFTVPSIMGLSGGTGRYELTDTDRDAARRYYARVRASIGK